MPHSRNEVVDVVYYVASSLDGYIATPDGGVDWLSRFRVAGEDHGAGKLEASVDALLLGSYTYEFALKLMETSYVVAERFSSADFLHGPVAMIERHFPVFLFAPPGVMLAGTKDLIGRLRELKADTLAITADLDAASICTRSIIMPRDIDEFLAPIPYIIPAQLFAGLLAEGKGLDPDQPRSLSKVTRTL